MAEFTVSDILLLFLLEVSAVDEIIRAVRTEDIPAKPAVVSPSHQYFEFLAAA